MTAPEAPTGFGKGLLALQGGMGAKDVYDGIQEGDAWKTGVGAADALAGAALFTPAAPIAGAYLSVRGAYDMAKAAGGAVYDNLSEKARDIVGGTVNQIGMNTGLWGTDDSAKMQLDAAAPRPADTLRKTAPGASPDPRDPYAAANAAKIAASDAQNKAAAAPKPGAAQRPEDSADVGRVIRDGNEYSGVNVGGGGNITINGFAPGAGLNRGSEISVQNMAAADALAGSQLGGSMGRIQTARPSASPASLCRERLMDQLQSRELGARKTARLGLAAMDQQEQAANQRYATDSSLRGQMYSSDAQLGVKRMEMQQRLRQQQMLGEIYRGSGGDPVKAARAAASLGLDGKPFLDMAAANQTLTQNNVKDARSTFDNMFTRDGKNGPERDENAEAMANQLADQIAPGYSTMSAEQRAAARPKIIEATRMVQGMNTLRNSTWAQKFGIDDPTPGYSQLPDLNGALVDSTGFLEGLLKPNAGRSDTKITLRDGSVRYLPKGSLTEAQQRILEENGAKRAN